MKAILTALLLGGVSFGNPDSPLHVRVSIQFIEMPHPVLTELLAGKNVSGSALHEQAMVLSKTGKAEILDTCMVVCRSGMKATVESILEEIFPTEYGPFSWPGTLESESDSADFVAKPLERFISAFETKNTGLSLEIEPIIGDNRKIIDLRMSPEFVRRIRLDTHLEHVDEWGDASMRMPVYEKWSAKTNVLLLSGKSELVSVITPKQQPAPPAVSRRIMLFVRADVIELLPDPK